VLLLVLLFYWSALFPLDLFQIIHMTSKNFTFAIFYNFYDWMEVIHTNVLDVFISVYRLNSFHNFTTPLAIILKQKAQYNFSVASNFTLYKSAYSSYFHLRTQIPTFIRVLLLACKFTYPPCYHWRQTIKFELSLSLIKGYVIMMYGGVEL
jgi:hypothetical protein